MNTLHSKKRTRPDVGASERAGLEAETWQATASITKDTTAPSSGQALKIFSLLSHGAENGVTLHHLEKLTDLDGRTLRLMIRQERLGGVPICENSRSGYYMPSSTDERDTCAKRLRHRAAQIVAVANAIAEATIEKGEDGIA